MALDGKPVTAGTRGRLDQAWAQEFDGARKLHGRGDRPVGADARTIRMVTKQHYGMVLESLGKSSSNVPF